MNDYTMYDAVSGIDEKYLAASEDGEAVKAAIRSARRKRRVVLLSACACVILLVCAVGPIRHYLNHMPGKEPTPIVEPGRPDDPIVEPEPDVRPPYIYCYSSSESLIKVDSLNYHGIYYSVFSRDGGLRTQKYAVFEATVDEDFYHNLEHGETIYLKFPVTFYRTDGSFYQFDADPFIQGLQACDSLILYVQGIDDSPYAYVYPNESCEPEEGIRLGKTCISYYYSNSFIPIRDSRVDFSFMEDALEKGGYEGDLLSWEFQNINWSGVSITQGDSLEVARNVILQLIDSGIYGGGLADDPQGETVDVEPVEVEPVSPVFSSVNELYAAVTAAKASRDADSPVCLSSLDRVYYPALKLDGCELCGIQVLPQRIIYYFVYDMPTDPGEDIFGYEYGITVTFRRTDSESAGSDNDDPLAVLLEQAGVPLTEDGFLYEKDKNTLTLSVGDTWMAICVSDDLNDYDTIVDTFGLTEREQLVTVIDMVDFNWNENEDAAHD